MRASQLAHQGFRERGMSPESACGSRESDLPFPVSPPGKSRGGRVPPTPRTLPAGQLRRQASLLRLPDGDVARAAGLQVIDGPYFKLHDPDGLAESCARSASCGYDGKWAVHPEQLPEINHSYSPDQASFDTASAIVDIYEKALREQAGAVAYDGEMVDEATRKVAARTVARGVQAGMVRSPQAGS